MIYIKSVIELEVRVQLDSLGGTQARVHFDELELTHQTFLIQFQYMSYIFFSVILLLIYHGYLKN